MMFTNNLSLFRRARSLTASQLNTILLTQLLIHPVWPFFLKDLSLCVLRGCCCAMAIRIRKLSIVAA